MSCSPRTRSLTRDVAELAAVDWGRLVLDEAQQIKNPGAAQTKARADSSAPAGGSP